MDSHALGIPSAASQVEQRTAVLHLALVSGVPLQCGRIVEFCNDTHSADARNPARSSSPRDAKRHEFCIWRSAAEACKTRFLRCEAIAPPARGIARLHFARSMLWAEGSSFQRARAVMAPTILPNV